MSHRQTRRNFLETAAATGIATYWVGARTGSSAPNGEQDDTCHDRKSGPGNLTINDDGHVFLWLSDDLNQVDLRRYLESYCHPGVRTVAFCVGDMSWPTIYPTKVGMHYGKLRAGTDLRRLRMYKNVERFSDESGGYLGATFRILRDLGKQVLASFRMNDAHVASAQNPYVSDFWKQHADRALGSVYGYYGGCLDYAQKAVRDHIVERVLEFAQLYPEIDGIELDAMRSPFFFHPGKGPQCAELFTDVVRKIKSGLSEQSKRLNRPDYLLTMNVPITPELALDCGLDIAAWDAEKLVDCISVGTYQAEMNLPIERWRKVLTRGTPVYAYINCGIQAGRYLGLEEYRAAAANAFGSGADGIYLFNYPCLFELAMQEPSFAKEVKMALSDMRQRGQIDFSTVASALDEIGCADRLKGKDKHFLFYFNSDSTYRHYSAVLPGLDRHRQPSSLKAPFRCYENVGRAREISLRYKIENVARTEQFKATLNDKPIEPRKQQIRYAANGRDTRTHTVTLGPYFEYEVSLAPRDLRHGENVLEVTATQLDPAISTSINLTEVELSVRYENS